MDSIKVLLVHDQAIMRDGFRALLDGRQDIMIVGEAADGCEALAVMAELAPDIVIMDLTTTSVSELEAIELLEKGDTRCRVLLFIDQDNADQMGSALRMGVAGCLSKMARGEELIEAIRTVHRGESFIHPSLVTELVTDYRSRISGGRRDQLTKREVEILKLVASGCSSRDIVSKLNISLKTVNGHRAHFMAKLKIHNRAELIKYAIRKGIVSLD